MTNQQEVFGIIGAMDNEIALFRETMTVERTERCAAMDFYIGTLENTPAVLVKSGVGKVNAGICAQILISRFNVTKIINTGVAGALSEDLDIGDLVISTEAIQHDFDASVLGFAKGEILYTGMVAFPADEDLREKAVEAISVLYPDFSVNQGRICSGDQFISSLDQKQKIISEFGGLCCDMEGAAIAQACWLNSVPWVVLRAISDKVDGTGDVQFESFADLAAHCSASVVLHMLAK